MNIYRPLLTEFESAQQLYAHGEDFFVDRVLSRIAEDGVARVALSGGQTPLPLYSRLSINPVIEWSKIELYQTDERYTDSSQTDSNQFQINTSLDIAAKEVRELNYFNTKLPLEMAVKDYSEKLDSLDGIFFDLTILGIGEDGHFASLFPGGRYLKHDENVVIPSLAPDYLSVSQRMSLTIESILNSRDIMVLLVGENKKDVLPELLEGSKSASEFPAKFLLAHPSLNIFFCT